MALSAQELRDCWRYATDKDATIGTAYAKPDLQAAATALDTWITANKAAAAATIPAPFSGATAQQKWLIFIAIAMKQGGLL